MLHNHGTIMIYKGSRVNMIKVTNISLRVKDTLKRFYL